VDVKSFKEPVGDELTHDFLWRVHLQAPAMGMMKIFNRSHYEDVLITRVHGWIDDETAMKRMKAINDFEELLVKHNNTVILKFYLHVSPEEQKERLEERKSDPTKMWKYNKKDFIEEKLWNKYMKAYEDCFEYCDKVPWIIVPSDQNWYKEYIIASTLRDALLDLKMKYPEIKL
jgi:polyphosphate kinase 2 (PPK2 family)